MTDFKKLAEDATARAALAAGKDAAKRAVDGLLAEGSEANAQSAEAKKTRRWKLIAISILSVCVIVGFIGLLLNYWYWFLAIGLLGIAGLYARHRLRRRLAEKPAAPATAANTAAPAGAPAKPAAGGAADAAATDTGGAASRPAATTGARQPERQPERKAGPNNPRCAELRSRILLGDTLTPEQVTLFQTRCVR